MVESYLPIANMDGPPEGVFELYTDVTPLIANINRSTLTVVFGLLAIFGALYGTLYLIVRRASGIMKRQYAELQRSEEVEEKNRTLEREIQERVRVETELRENHNAMTELHEIIAASNQTSGETIDKIVELGTRVMGLPMGVVGRIDGDDYVVSTISSARKARRPPAPCLRWKTPSAITRLPPIGRSAYTM